MEPEWIDIDARNNIYKGALPILVEGEFNPFAEKLLVVPDEVTLGQVFINGKPLVEVDNFEQLSVSSGTWMSIEGKELIIHFPVSVSDP